MQASPATYRTIRDKYLCLGDLECHLAIRALGNRLGQGGGSYDRALSRSKAFKIALLHYGELTSEILPIQPHDEKIDAAATPEIVVRF